MSSWVSWVSGVVGWLTELLLLITVDLLLVLLAIPVTELPAEAVDSVSSSWMGQSRVLSLTPPPSV